MGNFNKVNPFIIVKPDFCYICGKAHVVDVFNVYDKSINLAPILNCKKNIRDAINVPLKYARCRSCGARFKIAWNPDGSLRMIHDPYATRDFVDQFKDFEMEDIEDAYSNAETKRVFRD